VAPTGSGGPGSGPIGIADLDRLDPAACAAALAPLFEGAPRFLARLAAARPFGDAPTLFARAREIAHAMPRAEQVELIDAHPRLGAPPGSVSPLAFREQGYDREAAAAAADASAAERARVASELARLNEAYERRFGFRYCVFVAGRPRAALLPEMEAALRADRDSELQRALDAVVDIAVDRSRVGRRG
jgi:2-oxo-4-hydroxy-4-carboxy--5-ureidoimidazoline (OHCU) decarboxylase